MKKIAGLPKYSLELRMPPGPISGSSNAGATSPTLKEAPCSVITAPHHGLRNTSTPTHSRIQFARVVPPETTITHLLY